jgi:hypothetical protein
MSGKPRLALTEGCSYGTTRVSPCGAAFFAVGPYTSEVAKAQQTLMIMVLDAGCTGAVFMADSHLTSPESTVTKMDFDDEASPSLAEAIGAALEAVKTVPDLTVPSFTVPAQPAGEEASIEAVADEDSESVS